MNDKQRHSILTRKALTSKCLWYFLVDLIESRCFIWNSFKLFVSVLYISQVSSLLVFWFIDHNILDLNTLKVQYTTSSDFTICKTRRSLDHNTVIGSVTLFSSQDAITPLYFNILWLLTVPELKRLSDDNNAKKSSSVTIQPFILCVLCQ